MSDITIKKSDTSCLALLVLTGVLWSTGGVLVKFISWNPMAIAGTRSLLAMLVMISIVRRHDLTLSRTQIVGAICYSANVILFVVSMRLTTAANAILLQYTAPVYVAIGSLFILKERVRISDWIAIAIAIFGIGLFFFDRLTIQNIYGNLLSILSGIIFAGYIVCMRLQKNTSPIGSAFIGNILTAVICLPFMFGQLPESKDWVALSLLGIFQLGLAHVLYSIAIKRISALKSIMIPMIEPILNPLWVYLFLGEVPGKWAIPGGIIVISAVSMSLRNQSVLND
jgi:drug/metabolite transporter (DMT)-like permease